LKTQDHAADPGDVRHGTIRPHLGRVGRRLRGVGVDLLRDSRTAGCRPARSVV